MSLQIGEKLNPQDFSVLICDDEESIRSMLGEAVGNWGFQVSTAPNGEAALEYLQAGNLPHIILTDIRMGGITGIELAAEAKKLSKEIEVVIMTSHGTFETAVQAMRIGVFDYISKPFDNIEDVRTTLVHVAERIYLKFYSEYLMTELQQKNAEIAALAEMTEELNRTLDPIETLQIGAQGISKALGGAPTVFVQYLPIKKSLVFTSRSPKELFGGTQVRFPLPENALVSPQASLEYIESLGEQSDFLTVLEQSWSLNPEHLQVGEVTDSGRAPNWKVFPLITRGIPRGAFAFLPREWNAEDSPPTLNRYLQTISTGFENGLLHAKVVQSAIKDGLTGLFNVKYFKERFQTELQAAARLEHPLSLFFIDVDHFKKYNDTNGHPAGDQVLRMMADLMRKNFRGTDVLARYGGEEFVVLLPHTGFVDALEKAEAFRIVVEKCPFPNAHTQPLGKVSCSIGVAEFPSHGATKEAVIKAADEALYEGKKKSRNVVVPAVAAEGYVPQFSSRSVPTRSFAGSSEPKKP